MDEETETAEQPVLDVLAAMTAASIERARLAAPTLLLARPAALAAVGAPPRSYPLNLRVARGVGVTAQQVEGVLAAVAPVVGGPRVVAAAGNSARASGGGRTRGGRRARRGALPLTGRCPGHRPPRLLPDPSTGARRAPSGEGSEPVPCPVGPGMTGRGAAAGGAGAAARP